MVDQITAGLGKITLACLNIKFGSAEKHFGVYSMEKQNPRIGIIERFGTYIDSMRHWSTAAWRISALMAKGAYLLGERQRLFRLLGEKVFTRIQEGQIKDKDWEAIVHQLDKITKKIEIEERLIRQIRFNSSLRQTSGEETHP